MVAGGFIYISNDYGQNWSAFGPQNNWISICSSSDGVKLAAGSYDNYYYGAGNQAGSSYILLEVVFFCLMGWYEIIFQVYTHPRILETLGCGGIRVITTCGTDLLVPVTE